MLILNWFSHFFKNSCLKMTTIRLARLLWVAGGGDVVAGKGV